MTDIRKNCNWPKVGYNHQAKRKAAQNTDRHEKKTDQTQPSKCLNLAEQSTKQLAGAPKVENNWPSGVKMQGGPRKRETIKQTHTVHAHFGSGVKLIDFIKSESRTKDISAVITLIHVGTWLTTHTILCVMSCCCCC